MRKLLSGFSCASGNKNYSKRRALLAQAESNTCASTERNNGKQIEKTQATIKNGAELLANAEESRIFVERKAKNNNIRTNFQLSTKTNKAELLWEKDYFRCACLP